MLTAPVVAQQFPSQQRGLTADTAYQMSTLDSVNLFNGNLTVRIPIGQTYTVGADLSYGFSLYFNSLSWAYARKSCTNQLGQAEFYTLPEPDAEAQVGHGWMLHMGKLFHIPGTPQFTYIAPDGSQHAFRDQLHPGYPSPGAQPGTLFSTDGTYLRMKSYPAGSAECKSQAGQGTTSAGCRTVEMPNGIVNEFRDFDLSPSSDDWRLTRMRDAFGNSSSSQWVDVLYPSPSTGSFEVHDPYGRVQKVTMTSGHVSKVELTTFGGGTATYTFTATDTVLERQMYSPVACSPEGNFVTVPLLTRLDLPDGSFYSFEYYVDDDTDILSGGLKQLRTPIGGAMKWFYKQVDFSSENPTMLQDASVQTAFAVERKETYQVPGDILPVSVWRYAYTSVGNPEPVGSPYPIEQNHPCFHTTTVTDPVGNETVHYFSSRFAHWSYGLPFTYCDPATGTYSDQGPFLSQELYEGSATGGEKVRSVFVEYGSDGPLGGPAQDKNHRLTRRVVTYHDDGDRTSQTVFQNFDGFGHFRHVVTSSTIHTGDQKIVDTDYSPFLGELKIDPETSQTVTGNTFAMPAASDPWAFEAFDERRVTEGGVTATTEFCTDQATGFVFRTRQLGGASRSSHDVLTVYEREFDAGGKLNGFVGRVETYGGDDWGSLDNSYPRLCDMDVPTAAPRYLVEHQSAAGSLQRSAWLDPCDESELLSIADNTIDTSTGLVSRSRDPAGVETTFIYDTMARLTTSTPPTGARTEMIYQLPTAAMPNRVPAVITRQCSHASTFSSCIGSEQLAWKRSEFDGLGRMVKEERRVAEDSGVVIESRDIAYDAAGRKVAASTWGSQHDTTYSGYDRFGRVGSVKPPGQPATNFTYQGVRVTTREVQVATGATGAESSAFTTEIADGFGRLATVCEDQATAWNGSCTGTETRYGYDLGDRLVDVCQNWNGLTCGQRRFFDYDFRGFLTSEQHPEIGAAGNGTMRYSYDALGNVLSRTIDGSTPSTLFYRYDPAGRLLELDQQTSTTIRPIKEFSYARGNLAGDKRAGKLVLAKRHNWVDLVSPLTSGIGGGTIDLVVSNAFRYGGRDGAVSAKQVRYHQAISTHAYEMGFTWDELGNLETLTYPECLHGECAAIAAPARSVTYGYSKGFLTSVSGFAPEIDYQAGGMLHKIVHQNGVTDTVEINAADGLERPYRISTTAGWSTGVYDYDGAGNVKAIGSQLYQYDRRSRLLRGEVLVGSVERVQTAAYDTYGNLTQLTTNGATQTPFPSSTTNRIGMSGSAYDRQGNLTDLQIGGERYVYDFDVLNMMKSLQSTTDQARLFVYDPDDERVMTFDCIFAACQNPQPTLTVTVRGLGGKVLREYRENIGQGWEWTRDYVYRDGQPLATVENDGQGGEATLHLHLDHLGTPRQITDTSGIQVAFHSYYPFGEEATSAAQDGVKLKFTGHERDAGDSNAKGVLDYMHARHETPALGRFLSFDPVMQARRAQKNPQLWNRYGYALGNPLAFTDPSGEDVSIQLVFDNDDIFTDELREMIIAKVQAFWESLDIGDVYVFDSAQFNETNGALFATGVAKIRVSNGRAPASHARNAKVGAILGMKNLSPAEKAQGIANTINHEVFSHQFNITPVDIARMDSIQFDAARSQDLAPKSANELLPRVGTLVDSLVAVDPRFRDGFFSGPLPLYAEDRANARSVLGDVDLKPPSRGTNQWWRFW